jgi:hypothetical protein
MRAVGSRLIVSATDVSGFLACRHLTTLDWFAQHGGPKPTPYPDPGADVLRERGHQHEAKILEGYRARGLEVEALEWPKREEGDSGLLLTAEQSGYGGHHAVVRLNRRSREPSCQLGMRWLPARTIGHRHPPPLQRTNPALAHLLQGPQRGGVPGIHPRPL